jgi:hypothetical protein
MSTSNRNPTIPAAAGKLCALAHRGKKDVVLHAIGEPCAFAGARKALANGYGITKWMLRFRSEDFSRSEQARDAKELRYRF